MRTRFRGGALAAAALAMAAQAAAQGGPDAVAEEADAVVAAYGAAIAACDSDTFSDLHAPDFKGMAVNSRTSEFNGSALALMCMSDFRWDASMQVLDRWGNDDMQVRTIEASGVLFRPDGSANPNNMRLTLVLERQPDGAFGVVHSHYSVPLSQAPQPREAPKGVN